MVGICWPRSNLRSRKSFKNCHVSIGLMSLYDINVTSAVTADEIQIHIKELLSQVNLRILVAGNINKAVGVL